MRKMLAVWITGIGLLTWQGAPAAHHSLAQFDLTVPIWMKGTVVRFDRVSPHSLIFIEQTEEDGQTQRLAVDGPAPNALARRGIGADFVKAGDVIEVCGFFLKEGASGRSSQARPMSGHLLVLPDG